MGWFDSVEHNRWLSAHMQALIRQAEGAIVPTGFAHLTPTGQTDPTRPIDLAVTGRMLYVFSLGTLMGLPGSRRYADHAVKSLRKYFADTENGGMWTSIKAQPDDEGRGVPWDAAGREKSQFHQAFLILGAAAATVADRPGAHELLVDALHEQERHWLAPNGLVYDQFDQAWTEAARIHSSGTLLYIAEAYLAAAEATTDPVWIERAEVMMAFVAKQAEHNNWRLPEYFDDEWRPYKGSLESVTDGRRHYEGSVIGRQMQAARLALNIRAALRSMGRNQPDYLLNMAQEMFERARVDGWRRNEGHPGFATTVDRNGEPIDSTHQQWVVSEGICATVALRRALLDDGAGVGEVEHFAHCYRSWLDYVNDYLITEPGRWRRALSATNEVLSEETASRWDVYHALQTMLSPRVPLWPPYASAVSRGLLDKPGEPPADKKSWNFFSRNKH